MQASFNLEVFDWNQIEQAKSLGLATIELADLEPFQSVERTVSLASSKHGEKGSIRIRLLFQPAFIMKSRKNTSTFSAAGRAMTQMGGLPLDAGKGVFQGVGSVSKLAKGVFTGRKEKSSDEATLHDGTPSLQLTSPSNTVLATASGASALASGVNNGANGGLSRTPQTGLLKFVALGAKDLSLHGESSVKPYLSVRSGVDEHKTKHAGKTLTPEWNETFTFSVGPELRTLHAAIYDHKTLGRDKNLGEVEIDVSQSPSRQTIETYRKLPHRFGVTSHPLNKLSKIFGWILKTGMVLSMFDLSLWRQQTPRDAKARPFPLLGRGLPARPDSASPNGLQMNDF